MTKKEFLRLALLFTAANSNFGSMCKHTWGKTLREAVNKLLELAEEYNVIDDEPEQPP